MGASRITVSRAQPQAAACAIGPRAARVQPDPACDHPDADDGRAEQQDVRRDRGGGLERGTADRACRPRSGSARAAARAPSRSRGPTARTARGSGSSVAGYGAASTSQMPPTTARVLREHPRSALGLARSRRSRPAAGSSGTTALALTDMPSPRQIADASSRRANRNETAAATKNATSMSLWPPPTTWNTTIGFSPITATAKTARSGRTRCTSRADDRPSCRCSRPPPATGSRGS